MEEARLPETEPATRPWFGFSKKDESEMDAIPGREWTLQEFISTSVSPRESREIRHFLDQCGRYREPRRPECEDIRNHDTPRVEWEVLHPLLPIVRVTAHAEQSLPLPLQPTPQVLAKIHAEKLPLIQQLGTSEDVRHWELETRYSVSFVISFQTAGPPSTTPTGGWSASRRTWTSTRRCPGSWTRSCPTPTTGTTPTTCSTGSSDPWS